MKKTKLFIAALLSSGLALSGCDFQESFDKAKSWVTDSIVNPVAKFFGLKKDEEKPQKDDDEPETPVAVLSSISVSGQFKTEYEQGESFDASGIVVTAVFDDGSSKDVSSEASFSGFSSESLGSNTVTVSYGGQTASISLTIVKPVKRAWSAEEMALFDEYLHGIELPFLEVEGASVAYDSENEALRIFDEAGEPLAVEGTQIADYAAKFVASDGWEDVSSQYSAYSSAPAGSFYVFERSTDTEEGMRRISVQFFGSDGSNYATTGSFALFANDPFNYEFPSALMAAEFEAYGMTPFTISAPDGDGLFYEFYPDSYNELYVLYDMEDSVNATIYIYGLDETSFASYKAKLESDGWAFGEPAESGLMKGELEVEPNLFAKMSLAYTSNFTYLNYNYLIQAPAAWPTDEAAEFLEAIVPGTSSVIPPLEGAEAYEFYTDHELDVYGSAELEAQYVAILLEAGWTASELTEGVYISPAQDVQVEVYYNSTYGCLELTFTAYVAPSATWPSEDVAALIPEGYTDSLPAFEGEADSFLVYNDAYGMGVTVFVGEGNEDAAIAAYGETLLAANFVAGSSESIFVSPSAEFSVELWKGTDGAFNIEISIIQYFPSADVATALASLDPSITDVLPPLEGASSYSVYLGTAKVQVVAGFSSSESSDALDAYYQALLAAGFSYAGDDSYGDPHFDSPNGQFEVCPWLSSSGIVIDIVPGTFVPPVAGWDANAVATAVATYISPDITDTVPALDYDVAFEVGGDTGSVQISASVDDADAAVADYASILLGAGYTEAGADTYGDMHYASPSSQLDVCAWASGSFIVIDIVAM